MRPSTRSAAGRYEAGVKQNLLGDRLFATLALYRIWKSNVPTTDPEDTRFSILTGEQRSRGGEVEVTGTLSTGWNLMAAYLVHRRIRQPR